MTKLTNEELIAKAKTGDKQALNTLFDVNSRLVQMVARRYRNCGLEHEDLVSICNIGMMDAYLAFDESKNFKFTTLVVRVMSNKILKILRENKSQKRSGIMVSMNEPINRHNNQEEITIEDIIEDYTYSPDKSLDDKDNLCKLNNALDKLSEKDRRIIVMTYFENMTQSTISSILGISQAHVCRLINKALRKLRDIFEYDLGCLAE